MMSPIVVVVVVHVCLWVFTLRHIPVKAKGDVSVLLYPFPPVLIGYCRHDTAGVIGDKDP